MVIVTFKNSYDKLVSMFTTKYNTVEEARVAIELDGDCFETAHHHHTKHDSYVGKKRHASKRWNKKYDYYEVKAIDGESCVWQYFEV